MRDKYINLKDFRIHYLEGGAGECIVLLPSLWVTSGSYRAFGEKLENKFRVIIPDLGNTGKSSGKRLISSLDDYTFLVDEFLKGIRVKKFFLVGVSFSGMIAAKYSVKFPQKMKGLFLASTTLVPVKMSFLEGVIRYNFFLLENLFYKGGLRLDWLWLSDALIDFIKHPRQFLKDGSMGIENLKSEIGRLEVPSLLLLARHDIYVPSKYYVKMRKIKSLKIEVVSGPHAWFFLKPEEFIERLENFIKTAQVFEEKPELKH